MTTPDDLRLVLLALPRLREALRQANGAAQAAGFVTGGSPSYELVNLAVEALLADVRREATEFLDAYLRRLGEPRFLAKARRASARPLDDLLPALVTHYSAAPDSPLSAVLADRADRWAKRTQLVLGEVRAPYALQWLDGTAITCPVVEWRKEAAVACKGTLRVHRDNESGVPAAIRCTRSGKHHAWESGPAWLRLGALLGGVH